MQVAQRLHFIDDTFQIELIVTGTKGARNVYRRSQTHMLTLPLANTTDLMQKGEAHGLRFAARMGHHLQFGSELFNGIVTNIKGHGTHSQALDIHLLYGTSKVIRTAGSPPLHKAVQHHFAPRFVKIHRELIAINCRNITGAEFYMKDAVLHTKA